MIRNRIFYSAVLGITVLINILFQNRQTYTALFVAIALPVISLALTLILRSSIRVVQQIENTATKGSTIKYSLHIKNLAILPCPLVRVLFRYDNLMFFNVKRNLSLVILPRKTKLLSIPMKCRYRGQYTVGVEGIQLFDLLGIFSFPLPFEGSGDLTVYPQIIDISRKLPMYTSNHVTGLDEDYTTIMDLRQYNMGDSMKIIHWKLSAKSSEIIVKKFAGISKTSDTVFIDTYGLGSQTLAKRIYEDAIIEAGVALVYAFTTKGMATDLIYTAETNRNSIYQNASFDQLYAQLAQTEFSESFSLPAAIHEYIEQSDTGSRLWVVCGQLNELLFNVLCRAAQQRDVRLFITGHAQNDISELIALLEEQSVQTFIIPRGTSIEQALA